jgi:DNA-binding transcriptional LysR family regulator
MRAAPSDEDGLDSAEICSEPRVVVVRADDVLARRGGVVLADVAHLPVIRSRGGRVDPFLLWPPDEVASVSSVAGPVVGESSEVVAMVLLGQGVAFVPESVAAAMACPSVSLVRVLDCPPSVLRAVWRRGEQVRSVAELVWHARAYGRCWDRPAGLASGMSLSHHS